MHKGSSRTKSTQIKTFKINWILLLTLLGVIAAWTPFLFEKFAPVKIKGKLISVYDNFGMIRDEEKAFYLFKISVVSLNQSFDLKDIDININFEKNGWSYNTSINQRETFFIFENKLKKLKVSESSFLNNLSVLRKDEPAVGYLMTTSPIYQGDNIKEFQIIFKSFSGKQKKLFFEVNKFDETKFLFDESIWIDTDSSQTKATGLLANPRFQ